MAHPPLGATGRFLRIAILHHEGKVMLAFGKQLKWIGFTPAQAREIAAALNEHADKAEG